MPPTSAQATRRQPDPFRRHPKAGASVPNDNIDRAVKRGSGAKPEVPTGKTVLYEGYAPGVAVLVECLTDNRNRATSDVGSRSQRQEPLKPGLGELPVQPQGRVIVPKADTGETPS